MQAQENHLSRRDLPSLLAKTLFAGAVAPSLLTAFPASSVAAGALGSPESPIVVIGSGGETGMECVKRLAAAGYSVRATTRSESSLEKLGVSGGNVQLMAGIDVTKPETLGAALAGAGAVIFTSSASSKGGKALAVDCLGVENIGRAAIANNVPRLAVVSSVGVTRPDSFAFKLTNNLFGNIMDYKEQGEERLRALYAAQDGLSYTIVRPGDYTSGKGVGITALQVSQGDTCYTKVNRADVAEVTVASLFFPAAADTTFEVYQRAGVKPIQDGLQKVMYDVSGAHTTDTAAKASDAVLSEASQPAYSAFFAGLKKDSDFAVTNGYKAQKPVA
jgi:putative NADH-flavin reductase